MEAFSNVWMDAAMRYFTAGKMQYDKDGLWAKRGKVNEAMVEEVLSLPYFSAPLPKTTGRELFGDAFAHTLIKKGEEASMSKEDIVATLTRITAKSIVDAFQRYVPQHSCHSGLPDVDDLVSGHGAYEEAVLTHCLRQFLCGGGGFNPAITDYIRAKSPNTRLQQLDGEYSTTCTHSTKLKPDAMPVLGIPAAAKEAISFALLGMECVLGRPILIPQHVDSRSQVVLGKITPHTDNWHTIVRKVANFGAGLSGPAPTVTQMKLV
jgi:1,6-anhydro-N-acetylmuramate kinase